MDSGPFPVQARRLRLGTLLLRPAWAIGFCFSVRRQSEPKRTNPVQVREQTILPAREKKTEQNCTELGKKQQSRSRCRQLGNKYRRVGLPNRPRPDGRYSGLLTV